MDQKHEETIYMIPRNLQKSDTIPIVGKIEINWKQIGYLVGGGIITFLSFRSHLPLPAKILISVLGFTSGITLSFVKIKGSEIDDLILNSLIYVQRLNHYKKFEKDGEDIVELEEEKSRTIREVPTQPAILSTKIENSAKSFSNQSGIKINIR